MSAERVKPTPGALTDEGEWQRLLAGLPLWQPAPTRTLVIAPHPDDETLGAGGLIARLRAQQVEVTVVAVTDGENAYPDSPGLAAIREREQTEALGYLGVSPQSIFRLRLPDSGLATHEEKLAERLLPLVSEETLIVAPWACDFHPDHEVCGRAAQAVATMQGASLASYFFWTWHRGTAETIEGLNLVSLPLSKKEQQLKQSALLCHTSQLERASDDPILPPNLLGPGYRAFEVFLPL